MNKTKRVRINAEAKEYSSTWTVAVSDQNGNYICGGTCHARQNVGKTALEAAAEHLNVPTSRLKLSRVIYVD